MSKFKDYIEHGWVLVEIKPGQKGPRAQGWNQRKNGITDPEANLHSAGLAHAYSGTCAIDIDDYEAAAKWLAEKGVDLDALFDAPESVHISSGRDGHGKLLYALAEPLASWTLKNDEGAAALNFRSATAAGLTVQDVLPPSIHPKTGEPYKWQYGDSLVGDWRDPPTLPEELHAVWLAQLEVGPGTGVMPEKGASVKELKELLQFQDPDMSREDWIRVGMAIHHETDGGIEGFRVWDEWSQKGSKYKGPHDLEVCWRSFHDTPNAVTVGMLRQGSSAKADEFEDVSGVDIDEDDPWVQAEAAKLARFSLTHVGDVARRPPPDWLIEGLVPQADLAMMYGNPGAGKSFVALDLAFSVSTGVTFFNHRVENTGPVVWIAAEAAGAMRNRAKAYAEARGIQLDATDLWVIEQNLSLLDKEDAKAVIAAITPVKPRLIIIDTLAAASGGANENSGEDMNQVLTHCRKLHEATNGLVMIVHHSGKDAARGARGWSGLKAAMHTEFMVQHDEDSPIRVLKSTKQRDAEDGVALPFKLATVQLSDGENTSCVVDPLDAAVLAGEKGPRLGGNQAIVFKVAFEQAGLYGEDALPPIQGIYDDAMIQLPPPIKGERDRRGELVRRALQQLHEKGLITIRGENYTVGAPIYDDED